jgi:hypothetical protein
MIEAQLKLSVRSLHAEPDAGFYCRITDLARMASDLYRTCYWNYVAC